MSKVFLNQDKQHSLLFPQQASHLLALDCQVSQAWVQLHKSMLPVTLSFMYLEKVSRSIYFDHLPKDWDEFDQPVIPGILLLTFLQGQSDICFLPVNRNYLWSPWTFKEYWEWPGNDIGHILSHPMHGL